MSLHVADGATAIVNWCGVNPAFRRQGHASNALRHALQYARDVCGCTDVLLSAVDEGPLALYQGLGFEVVAYGNEIQCMEPLPEATAQTASIHTKGAGTAVAT